MAKAMMIGGTASHVGKSWMATAICRWLHRKGIRVAPFKAQNMSNNSFPCVEGGEIGRAQVAQAEACGLKPSADMNPILLKPAGEMRSQVVVQGKAWRNMSAREYYSHHQLLFQKAAESFLRLANLYEFIVVEGAGSIAELNLRQTDLVNLGFARKFDIPVLLLADIDRGGVFSSVYGTLRLLDNLDRDLVRAFAINRFRGDQCLFHDGRKLLEEKTGKPCLGVFPFESTIKLDQEDSLSLGEWVAPPEHAPSIAIIRFPQVSNHTDFHLLSWAFWIQKPLRRQFDVVILPGTKNTIADLLWMRSTGLDRWLREQVSGGAKIYGICGGYQMLGEVIEDPKHVESSNDSVQGLGILPVKTTMVDEKITRAVMARTPAGIEFAAYEIHMGRTICIGDGEHFATIGTRKEGLRLGTCAGTYLHGLFDEPDVVEELIGFRPPNSDGKPECYNQLADWFERAVDFRIFDQYFL